MTMIDNTWATPLIYRPLEHGIDLAIYAGTKYQAGHSDLLIGSISANEKAWPALQRLHKNLGTQAGTEEIWLTLRGLRTMGVRLERHERSALEIARWLQARKEVARVLHPALPGDPGHAIWKRDFGRSTGLFGFVLNGEERGAKAFLNALRLFGLGFSWGGFESLAVLGELERCRTVRPLDRGADHPPAHRAGGRRRPDRRPGARLRGHGGGLRLASMAERPHARMPWLAHGAGLARRAFELARTELALTATIFVLAGGLWAFVSLADEVGEGETEAFDRTVLLALRNPADLSDPIGPLWLEGTMRDITALGGHFVLTFVTLAVIGYLLLAGKRGAALLVFVSVAGGAAPRRPPEARLPAAAPRPRAARRAGLHGELPEQPRHALGRRLPDARHAARPPGGAAPASRSTS